MASADLLQTLLHLHLANDANAVCYLPYVLPALSSQDLETSQHLTKWTNRVNALMGSREPGARWAGLCLALHTARLSRNTLVNVAQGWTTTALPMLSRPESHAVWKAALRLLAFIFTTTSDLIEFQRQIVTPNVPKLSLAIISLVEKQGDEELKIICLDILSCLVSRFPSLHRPLQAALSNLALGFLNGRIIPTPAQLIDSASRLHAILHSIGGKVGGSTHWRKSLDEAVIFCSSALSELRTTYPGSGSSSNQRNIDHMTAVAVNVDRLRCGISSIKYLLRTRMARPISFPVNSLVALCIKLIIVTAEGEMKADVDQTLRGLETSVVWTLHNLGCELLLCVSMCVQRRLAPRLSRVLSIVAYHLEQPTPLTHRLLFVKVLQHVLGSCYPPSDSLLIGRIIKSILPSLAVLLSQKVPEERMSAFSDAANGKKGKKRARGFEGDDVFKVGPDLLCKNLKDSEMILAILDALPFLLRTPNLPAYLQSISSRILLSLLIALPETPAVSVSEDWTLKDQILRRLKKLCFGLAAGSRLTLSRSLPLILAASTDTEVRVGDPQDALFVDLTLHPRLPPMLHSLPSLDTVTLITSEEGTDERTTRQDLGLRVTSLHMEVDEAALDKTIRQESAVREHHPTPGSLQAIPRRESNINGDGIKSLEGEIPQSLSHSAEPLQPNSTYGKDGQYRVMDHYLASTSASGDRTILPQTTPASAPAGVSKVSNSTLSYPGPSLPADPAISASNKSPSETTPSLVVPTTSHLPIQPVATPRLSSQSQGEARKPVAMSVNDDEDDDNIEIPPINMESDTEDEELP